MMSPTYHYRPRAVAFLDVLGFKQKLGEFQQEAELFFNEGPLPENAELSGPVYYSKKDHEFIETFKQAVSKLDPDVFSYFLFSDNICITGKEQQTEKSLIDLMLVITELYYEFAKKGYFLRGGVDFGLLVDEETLAIGAPLATAYDLETKTAIYPRIVLSENFVEQFVKYGKEATLAYNNLLLSTLIRKHCEISYLNVFCQIFKTDEKEEFLASYQERIIENLKENDQRERVFSKYEWLAKEFNSFIDLYTNSLIFFDENDEPTDDTVTAFKKMKIDYV